MLKSCLPSYLYATLIIGEPNSVLAVRYLKLPVHTNFCRHGPGLLQRKMDMFMDMQV